MGNFSQISFRFRNFVILAILILLQSCELKPIPQGGTGPNDDPPENSDDPPPPNDDPPNPTVLENDPLRIVPLPAYADPLYKEISKCITASLSINGSITVPQGTLRKPFIVTLKNNCNYIVRPFTVHYPTWGDELEIGTGQAFIQPLDSGASQTNFGRAAKVKSEVGWIYGAGGAVIAMGVRQQGYTLEQSYLNPNESAQVNDFKINTEFLQKGKYRFWFLYGPQLSDDRIYRIYIINKFTIDLTIQ